MNPMLNRYLVAGLCSTPLAFLLKNLHNSYWKEALIVGLGSLIVFIIAKAFIKGTLNWYINGFSFAIILLTALFKLLHFQVGKLLIIAALAAIIISVLNLFRNIFIPVREQVEE